MAPLCRPAPVPAPVIQERPAIVNIKMLAPSMLLSALLAACGAAPAAPPAPATPSQAAQVTAAGAPAVSITVAHTFGETTVEQPVTRIVAISEELLELPIALGIKPVGIGSSRVEATAGQPFAYRYLPAERIGEPVFVGTEDAPSLEAIAALQPDLILNPDGYGQEQHDRLAQIAPTLSYNASTRLFWKQALADLAQLTGTEAAAAQLSAAFDSELAKSRELLAPVVTSRPRVALVFLPSPTYTALINEQFAFGAILADLGLQISAPAAAEFNADGVATISNELLGDLDADSVVVYRFSTDRLPADAILAQSAAPVLDYVIDTERPAAGPITDFDYLRDLTGLLIDAP